MNIFVELGMRIAFLRHEKKWSQEDLALESDVNKNYLSDLERGRRNPSILVLNRIAKALGVTLETLFQGVAD
jgi:transcriptional regulator with XRE-family HTH domain